MAWLHSAPIDKTAKKQPDERITRAQKIEDKGGTPLMPPVYESAYLIDYWQNIGMVGSSGMGMSQLSAVEIMAWQDGKTITLNPWEFSVIRSMSMAYISQYYDAEKSDCPPPYGDPEFIFDRAKIAKDVQGAFKTLMAAK